MTTKLHASLLGITLSLACSTPRDDAARDDDKAASASPTAHGDASAGRAAEMHGGGESKDMSSLPYELRFFDTMSL